MKTAAALAAALALVAARAEARTWTVGGPDADFPFITPAVAAASAGDVIRVRHGIYRENVVLDKTVTLVGDGSPVLFGTGVGSVVTIVAPGCELRGFVIEGSGTGETNDMDAGVQLLSSGNRVEGNRLRRVFYGVVVVDAARNAVVDNEIEGLAALPFGRRGDGIYLYRAPETLVERNRISSERDAIYFQYAPRGRALDNVASRSRYALHDMFSDDTEIRGNTFSDSAVGANIMNSRRIRIAGNRFVGNRRVPGVGLTLKDCDGSIVSDNDLRGNARGLLLDGSSSNQFTGNRFAANDTAVTLSSSAEQNAFGSNSFTDNWSDVVLSGRDAGTRWSIDGRGNYWTRYEGFDFDGDGIGDAPHPLLGAFERIEGANPAARMFLQSPAAKGLQLAAKLAGGGAGADALDTRPLANEAAATVTNARTGQRRGTGVGARQTVPLVASGLALLLPSLVAVIRALRGGTPC